MNTDRYIWHVVLPYGLTRRSRKGDIASQDLAAASALLDAALTSERLADDPGTPLPIPGYRIHTIYRGRCLMVRVSHDDGTLLAIMGIADHQRCGAKIWRLLNEIPSTLEGSPELPQQPWSAVRLMPGMDIYPDAAQWLGDLERRLAWAWIGLKQEHKRSLHLTT
jgi:hypothetical protein